MPDNVNMPNNSNGNSRSYGSAGQHPLIAGLEAPFYWRAVRFFSLGFLSVEIIVRIANWPSFSHWVVEVMLFLLFNWRLKGKRTKLASLAYASIFLGILTGFWLAIFNVIWYRQWWYLLDLIRQPIILALLGLVVSLVYSLLFQSLNFTKTAVRSRTVSQVNNQKAKSFYGEPGQRYKKFK